MIFSKIQKRIDHISLLRLIWSILCNNMFKELCKKEMAELLGVSQQQVGRFESGKHELSGKRFLQIAEVCGVSLDYLAGRTIDPTRR